MQVRVIRGTKQIGGCVTEITSSKKTKILIDYGENLDNDDVLEIDGLTNGNKSYDAVFITHSHGDHIGCINHILDDIPVYVEPISKRIYEITAKFTHKNIRKDTLDMEFEKSIQVKDIKVTAYLADHSAYNAAMLLIEADGKKVLHTGDFRGHGTKGYLIDKMIQKIGTVDLIVTEGTVLSRSDGTGKEIICQTEKELTNKATEIFKKYDQVFILQSGTNIDRITSFYKAAVSGGKNFIEDLFTTSIVYSLDNLKIPNPETFNKVYTWIPPYYKNKIEFKEYVEPLEKYCSMYSYSNNKYVMLVKSSMISSIELLYTNKHITNACLIYSMWEGYQEDAKTKKFLDSIKKYDVKDIIYLHTSGHADYKTLKKLNELKAKKVIPIHTIDGDKLKEILDNVYIVNDNEGVDVI